MKKDDSSLLKIESYTVPSLLQKTRLQDIAAGIFVHMPTKSGVKKAIKNKLVRINGLPVSTGTFLLGGEIIDLFQSQEDKNKTTIAIELDVIYEDDYLALVNKPPGITVSGNKKWTLENALSLHLKKSNAEDALNNPEPIHRLDHPTSGILLIGKTAKTVIQLNQLFENRKIQKTYYAVAIGEMPKHGMISDTIDGKNALTNFKVIQQESSNRFEYLNLVELKPDSGRKHQIRIHLANQGNPIFGDKDYYLEGKILKGNGLYLHAYSLEFTHPITKENVFQTAPLTKKFVRLFPKTTF